MRVALTGRHIEVTPVIRRVVDTKLARLERMLNDTALSAQVVLSKAKTGYRADVMLHARGEKFLHGVGEAAAIQGCIGGAIDKISQQAQKMKGKWQERKRHGPQKDSEPVEEVVSRARGGKRAAAPAAVKPAAERPRMPRILRSSQQSVKDMSVAEAARQLDGSDGIVVFRDTETAAVSVLYRAPSGELTLVETTD